MKNALTVFIEKICNVSDPHGERLSGARRLLTVFTSADGGSFKQASDKLITLWRLFRSASIRPNSSNCPH